MAVDRGGLQYTISVRDEFSKATEKFTSSINAARSAFAAFKQESEGLAGTNSRITVTLNQATQASARKARQLSVEEEAERKLTRILRDRIVQEEIRTQAQQKGITLSASKIRQLSVEQEAERKLLKSARDAAVARSVEEKAAARGIDLARKRVQALTVEQEAQAKVASAVRKKAVAAKAEELAQQAGIEIGKKKVKQLSIEEDALARVAKAERARLVAAKVNQINNERFVGPPIPPGFEKNGAGQTVPAIAKPETLKGLALARQRVQEFQTALKKTDEGGNDLLFTFRRLFGVLALFQAARAIFTSFVDFIKSGIEFNATIEKTRLGIASLIVAVGQVKDEQGQTLDSANAFLAAQKEAVRQQTLLRAESLKTTATFSELLDTFQVATGPGIAAGLNLDQVRKFAVQISQAASAIGVAQNQLSEEVRSILSGTIQQRTTRIAAVLQISNEDIRNAKEAGKLFEFLQERFKTFGVAGEEAAKTFEGLTGILKGAIAQLAGLASAPLFDVLKQSLQEIIDLILTIGPDGAVIINPAAVEAVAPIFQGILIALQAIKETARGVGFGDLASSAKLIGASIAVAGQVIGGVVDGVIRGFKVVVDVISRIAPLFFGQQQSLEEIVALVTKYTVIFGSGVAAVGLLGFAVSALLSPFKQLITLVSALANGVLTVVRGFLALPPAMLKSLGLAAAVVAIFIAIANVVRGITEAIFGVNLSLKSTIELISLGFVGGILDAINFIEELGIKIGQSISEGVKKATDATITFIEDSRIAFNQLFGNTDQAVALVNAQADRQAAAEKELFDLRKKHEVELADVRSQNQAKSKAFEQEIANVVGDSAGQDALNKIPSTLQEILGGIGDLFKGIDLGFGNLLSGGEFSLDKILDLDGFSAKLKKSLEDATTAGQGQPLNIQPRGLPITDEQLKELANAQQKLAVTQQQAAAQRALNELTAAGAGEDLARLQQLKNQRMELLTQLDTQRAIDELARDKAQKELDGAQGVEQQVIAQANLATLTAQQSADQDVVNAKLAETNILLKQQQDIVTGTIGEGFNKGLQNFAQQFGSAFKAGIEIAQGLLTSFTSFVSDSIVSAFDPNNDTSIKERFAHFLQDIAKLIIQQLLQIQIAKLLLGLGLGGPTPGGVATGGSIGLAQGGNVPRRGRASLAHYGATAHGLAAGGATPPAGIDRRDTVPIWAQPGEFMQPLATVRAYGRDVMEALRLRQIDPAALRGLAGVRSAKRMAVSARRGPGFATGGLISDNIKKQNQQQAFAANANQGGGAQRAVLVAGESEFDKLMAGGNQAFLRFIAQNKDTVRGILDRG